MCGRFVCQSNLQEIAEYFGVKSIQTELGPSYNIAPTQAVAAIVHSFKFNTKALVSLRWGLIPRWAKDPKIASQLINARAETLSEKPSFRKAFTHRRCLIVANGFYEWQRSDEKTKQPMYIHAADQRPIVFAGLYEGWKAPEGQTIYTCSIITTRANAQVSPVHHRMPVILPRETHDLWLDPQFQNTDALSHLLSESNGPELSYYPISSHVNRVANNDPACLLPLEASH